MKKPALVLLIVLMSVSMLAVIGMQVFWLNNAYTIKKQEFDKQATAALNTAAQNLEDRRVAGFIHNKMDSMDLVTENIMPDDDSLLFSQIPHSKKSVMVFSNHKTNGNEVTVEVRTDSKTIVSNVSHPDKNNTSVTDTGQGSLAYAFANNINKREDIKTKTNHFKNVINKMVVEWVESNMPFDKEFNTDSIHTIIKRQLFDKGIVLPFEFALKSSDAKKKPLQSAGFKNNAPYTYYVSLSPASIKPSTDKLLVSFAQTNDFVLHSMRWLVGVSGLFTLLILLAFGGSIYFILLQKRIADIKTDFINNMTHEFKTPIATINVAIAALVNENVINDRQKQKYYTDIISEENMRMNRQVEQVLQTALLDKNQLPVNKEPIDMHAIIYKAVNNMQPQVQANGGAITTETGATNFWVKGNALHLTGVISNLLDNANKYSPEKPAIKVKTKNKDKKIVIEVTDNGIGMSKDTMGKIFQPFYRVATGNIHNQKGFGLGLSYAKSIIIEHGGSIDARSEKGNGSTFSIYLPVE